MHFIFVAFRLSHPIPFLSDTDLIKKVGPAGDTYLTREHTLRWPRSDEHYLPRLAVRGPTSVWEAEGEKSTYQLARELTEEYADIEPQSLSPERAARLGDIIAQVAGQ